MSQYALWGDDPAVFPQQLKKSMEQRPIHENGIKKMENPLTFTSLPMYTSKPNNMFESYKTDKPNVVITYHNNVNSPFNYIVNQNGIVEYTIDNNTWKQTNVKISTWITIACSNDGKYTLVASDSGSYYSLNGTDFYKCIISFNDVGMDETGQYQCGVGDDIYISKNYGKDWYNLQVKHKCSTLKKVNISQNGKYIAVINNTDDVFISNNYGETFRSCPEIPKGICVNIETFVNKSLGPNSTYSIGYNCNLTILNIGVFTILNGTTWKLMSGISQIIENTSPELITTTPISIQIVENSLYVISNHIIQSSPEVAEPPLPIIQSSPVIHEPVIPEPVPFPALQTKLNAFNTFKSTDDNANEIPLPKYNENDQSFMIQVHNTSDSTQWLEMNNAYVTISKNGYLLVSKDPHRQGPDAPLTWNKINSIKINSWIVLSGSYDGKYITIASDAGTFISSTFGETWLKIDYPFVFVGMNGSGQFQVGITSTECYISGNYGNSWKLFSVPEDNYQIVCVPSDATSILLSGSYHSYLISNGKTNMIKIPQGTVINASIQTMGNTKRYIIQINGKGLYQSTDGSFWTLLK